MFFSQRQHPRPRRFAALSRRLQQAILQCEHLEDRSVPSTARPTFGLDQLGGVPASVAGTPTGILPAVLRHAYGVDQVAFASVRGDGAGQTIAIIDAYDQPDITRDLAAFDRQFGLPDPPRFTRVNETGGTPLPRADIPGGWGVETSLDVEWVHTIAPQAGILLVEADSAHTSDLLTAVDTARGYPGVSVVSMSWGGDETAADSASDFHFTTPAGHNGVTFVAASGDHGAYSANASNTATVLYPAVSPNVVGVGGTNLTIGSDGSYVSENGWGNGRGSNRAGGSGGGISRYITQPDYQQGVVTQSSTFRTVPDVAIAAGPAGGVPVHDAYDQGDSTPWLQVGGTSLVAPLWAGVIALADQGRVLNGLGTLDGRHDTLPDLYALPAGDFHDITTGNNGYAAGAGYDLVTGRGSPLVNRLVPDLAGIAARPEIGTSPTLARRTSEGVSSLPPSLARRAKVGNILTIGTVTEANYYSLGFSNWSAIQPAIALVPTTAGQLDNVSVVNFGTTVYTGPLNVSNTINRIRADNGPISRDDGIVFNNSSHQLPPGGTYFEFDVAPSNGTDHHFTFAAPGPMRLVLNTSGSLYFTGDHYVTFTPVYVPGQSMPTIGSFTVNPSTVMSGASATLTAGNVTESGGTITDVSFYLESNGMPGLQIGSDTTLGSGTPNGTDWSFPLATDSFTPGSYILYAVATDDVGTMSAVASTTLTVTGGTGLPMIGSFTANPSTVQAGTPVTLTAGNVTDTGGTVTDVSFYLESNGMPGLQIGSDTTLGSGTPSGTNWSFSLATDGFTPGTYILYAVATDDGGNMSAVASTTLTVTNTVYTGVLLGWDVNGLTNFGPQGFAATQTANGVSNSLGLTRGSGVATSETAAANAWGGSNWAATSSAGISGNEFVTFGLTVSAGGSVSLSSIDLYYRRSSSGPSSGYWQFELNGGAWNTVGDFPNEFSSTSGSGAAMNELDLSGIGGLQNLAGGTVIVFRLVPYAASGSGGTWYVYDQPGNDLVINGTIQGTGGNSIIPPTKSGGGGADLAGALRSADQRSSVSFANPSVATYTDPFGAAPAFMIAVERAPVLSFGAPRARVTAFVRDGNRSIDGNDLFWLLSGDADVMERLWF